MSKTIEARQSTWLSKAAAALALIASVVLVLTPEWARAEPPASIPVAQAKVSADPAPRVTRAIGESQELWLEVADADDQAKALALIQKYGLSTNGPLTKKLSVEDLAQLDRISHTINPNASAAVFDPLRPWLVALQLTLVEVQKSGLDPKNGVDLALKAEFTTAKKPVNSIESFDQQIKLFADMTEAEELTYLHETLKDFDKSKEKLDDLIDAWARGDTSRIEQDEIVEMRTDSPKLYDKLLVQRNIGMAKAIKDRLDKTGVAFVAVGALHLVGSDSVQAQLEKSGIKAERLN